MHQIQIHQLFDLAVAQAFHVHGGAGSKMNQGLRTLCLASHAAATAGHRFAVFFDDVAATHGAKRGQYVTLKFGFSGRREQIRTWVFVYRPLVKHHPHHFRNHITRTAHHHGVAHAHVFALHFAFVVQSGIGHGHTAHAHRQQTRHRRHRACAADLHIDGFHQSRCFFSREFVRNRKTRRARHKAQYLLFGDGIDFNHHAINVKRQFRPLNRHLFVKLVDLRHVMALQTAIARRRGYAPRRQQIQLQTMRGLGISLIQLGDAVSEKAQ